MILIKEYKIENGGFESIFKDMKKITKKLAKDNEIVGIHLKAYKEYNKLSFEIIENEVTQK